MKFKLGHCVATRNAAQFMALHDINPLHLLMRHVNGDDGDLSADDKALNVTAIASGADRVLSAYQMQGGNRLLVITELDRSVTTILLPEDY